MPSWCAEQTKDNLHGVLVHADMSACTLIDVWGLAHGSILASSSPVQETGVPGKAAMCGGQIHQISTLVDERSPAADMDLRNHFAGREKHKASTWGGLRVPPCGAPPAGHLIIPGFGAYTCSGLQNRTPLGMRPL
jgi:hypothetical protein